MTNNVHQSTVDTLQSTVASPQSTVESPQSTTRSELTADDGRVSTLCRRVVIERIRPEIDGGRFPIKRTVGEDVDVRADIFADGHDVVVAVLRDRHNGGAVGADLRVGPGHDATWRETPMTLVAAGTDEWSAAFDVDTPGWHEYAIVAWVDRFRTWRRGLELQAAAGQDVSVDLL